MKLGRRGDRLAIKKALKSGWGSRMLFHGTMGIFSSDRCNYRANGRVDHAPVPWKAAVTRHG